MKGFTLVEVLVSSLIMSMIVAVLLVVLSMGQRSWFTGDVAVELRDQAVKAIMTMDKELSETRPSRVFDGAGVSLVEGTPVNSIQFDIPNDNNGDGSIVDVSGNIEWTGRVNYSLNASNQIIRTFAGTSSVLGNNIATLQFMWTADRLIQIDMTAQKTPLRGEQIQDIEQVLIKMRN